MFSLFLLFSIAYTVILCTSILVTCNRRAMLRDCGLVWHLRIDFSSPEQCSQRASVLPSAAASALASAFTNVNVFVKVFKTILFPDSTDLIQVRLYISVQIFRSTIPTTLGHVKVKVTDLEFSC